MQKKKKSPFKILLVVVAAVGLLMGTFLPFIPYIISLF